tara:strand:+ start:121 stop:387 length:267 start_codon:yes stop_codon:yes gene_type:complete
MHKADRRLTVTDTWQDRGDEEEKEEDEEEEEEDGESGDGAQLKRELRELARYQVCPRVRGAWVGLGLGVGAGTGRRLSRVRTVPTNVP